MKDEPYYDRGIELKGGSNTCTNSSGVATPCDIDIDTVSSIGKHDAKKNVTFVSEGYVTFRNRAAFFARVESDVRGNCRAVVNRGLNNPGQFTTVYVNSPCNISVAGDHVHTVIGAVGINLGEIETYRMNTSMVNVR